MKLKAVLLIFFFILNYVERNTKYEYKNSLRSVAQPGSASGLGPEGRRFESCHSDHQL